jgi:hypothetical protein
MQNRLTVCVLTTLSMIWGAAFAAQLTPAQKIDRVSTILKSLETAVRTRSASSKSGRLIYFSGCDVPFSLSESRGLAVALR